MSAPYEEVVGYAQTYGLLLLSAVFAIAVIYALWPGNRDTFNAAAHAPLSDEGENG